jgi:hypothetical protein
LDLLSVSIVAIRCLALFSIARALAVLPAAVVFLRRQEYPDGSSSPRDFTVVVSIVSVVVLAALLLIFARRVGALMTRGLADTSIQLDESNLKVVQRVAFSVLGAYLLVYSVPVLIAAMTIAVLPPMVDEGGGLFRSAGRQISVEDAVRICAEIALGLWLLVGGRKIVSSLNTKWKQLFSPSEGVGGDESP